MRVREFHMEERRECEDWMLTYLLHWPTCSSGRLDWQVPRKPAGVGAGIKG